MALRPLLACLNFVQIFVRFDVLTPSDHSRYTELYCHLAAVTRTTPDCLLNIKTNIIY